MFFLLMMAGTSAHVADGPFQECGELLLFLFGKALHDPLLVFVDDPVDLFDVFPALVQHIDPLAAAVGGIRAEFNEAFLFQRNSVSKATIYLLRHNFTSIF